MEVKTKDQRFGGHRLAKTIKFQEPINLKKKTEFELTYFNEGTGKHRTEKISRLPQKILDWKNFVVLYVLVSHVKVEFTVEKEHVIDNI